MNYFNDNAYFEDTNQNGVIDRATELWIPIIGIDGLDVALELIEKGYIYGTVLNDSESMAMAINELTDLLVRNESLSSLTFKLEENKYIWIDYKKIY